MSHDHSPRAVSRRRFLQGLGTSVVGTAVLPRIIAADPAKSDEELAAMHEGHELLALNVNGKPVRVLVDPATTLAELLRDHLQLYGTKIVCNHGECGGCTVLVNDNAMYSCHMLALDAAGTEVTTIEGLMDGEKLHPLQQAFVDHDGYQCGFCTPGQIMAAEALLRKNPKPSREQILEGMSGNLCRCAAYPNILDSVVAAAEMR